VTDLSVGVPTEISGIEKFTLFMRFLAPPTPSSTEPGGADSITRGKTLFSSTDCALCHTPALKTGRSTVAALSEKSVNLYSDLAVHNMGPGLADGVTQGQAGSQEFRTALLWGLGQRIWFLHDGRTSVCWKRSRRMRVEAQATPPKRTRSSRGSTSSLRPSSRKS
jgi:CxxC motif-containing protein (DUF1111 family)